MLRLLCFPNLTQPFVTDLALANIPHLLIKAFQLLSPGVGRRFDRALLRYRATSRNASLSAAPLKTELIFFSDSHIEFAPRRIEQDPIAMFHGSIRKCDQKQLTILPENFFDPT